MKMYQVFVEDKGNHRFNFRVQAASKVDVYAWLHTKYIAATRFVIEEV